MSDGYWRGSGVNARFYSVDLLCYSCSGDYCAEFDTEWSSADIEWVCELPITRPWWAFWRPKICGYHNMQEVEV
jgi:hypothetical protein